MGRNNIYSMLLVVVTATALILSACGGGGGSATSATISGSSATISGSVVKGPVTGATVTVFSLNTDGSKAAQLGITTTGASGNYTVTLTPAPTTPILVESSGGNYVDEATDATVTLAATDKLQAVLPAGTIRATVTPLTHIAAARAQALAAGGTPLTTAVDSSNTDVASQYGIADIITTLPPAANNATSVATSNRNERIYALVLAGIAQRANSAGVRAIDLAVALAEDAKDGILDGKNGAVATITIAGSSLPLTTTAGTTDVQTAINAFIASGNNMTNITVNIPLTPVNLGMTSVTPPIPAVSVSASLIASGATSDIRWTSTNSTSCTPPGGGGTATSGSFTTPALTATTTYTVTCTGPGGTANQNVTVSVFCSTVTYAAPSGTANDIVFTFDQPYVCGQYANGDWWVAPLTTGGTVTINSITPTQVDRTSGHIMNGAEVNPSSSTKQGFDTDSPGGTYDATRTAVLPLVINTTTTPISSVVKAASIAGIATGNSPQLQFAAVLTVINAPVNGAALFRPSYFGTNKFQLNTSSIVTSSLGQVDLTSVPSVAAYTFADVVAATSGLQLDHFNKFINQYVHAVDNSYKGTAYGSEASIQYSKNMMRFASNDFSYSNATDRQALINYLQWCIDLAGDVQGGTSFDASGGGYGFGRKLPLAFAGQVLQNSTITGLVSSGLFAEDLSFYVSPNTGRVLHGEYYSAGTPWTSPDTFFQVQVTGSGSKTVRDPMGWTDSGPGPTYAGAYLACCVAAPARYEAMTAAMLGFGSTTPFNNMLLISNRVQNHGLQFLPDPFAAYDGVPGNQSITWGNNVLADAGVFIAGSGRAPLMDGKSIAITHTDTMGENVWTYWIANHDIVPPSDVSTLAATQPMANENVLNWTASSGATSYNIYRATDTAEFLNSQYLNNTASTAYTDSGLTTGVTYAYWVVAVDASGNVSNMSNKVFGTSN